MRLWLLRSQENLPDDGTLEPPGNPWEPWFDRAFGFVVRAETEDEARSLAAQQAGKEAERDEQWEPKQDAEGNPWLDPKRSICIELTSEGAAEVIIRDFARA